MWTLTLEGTPRIWYARILVSIREEDERKRSKSIEMRLGLPSERQPVASLSVSLFSSLYSNQFTLASSRDYLHEDQFYLHQLSCPNATPQPHRVSHVEFTGKPWI